MSDPEHGASALEFARIKALFTQAIELPADRRCTFLHHACGDDHALRSAVESLLANDAGAGTFLETPAAVRFGAHAESCVFTPGQRLGTYEILASIGAGGMGEVYRARDHRLERDVALKVLPESFARDPERLRRFEREARVLAALNHPHIASIYGMEESGERSVLVLELVEGQTLAERLAETRRWPLPEVLVVAAQIADALDAAHEKGIVHRDLKPANVKITPEGVAKVLDFGLAKNVGDESSREEAMLSSGGICGTAAYMSPEQARGEPVDKRTDIWALGCVLYEVLTGAAAFCGETHSRVTATVLQREPDWTLLRKSAPPAVQRLVQRCLEKDRRRRIRDAGDIRLQLEDIAGMTGGRARTSRGAPRWLRNAALAAAVLAAAAVGVWLVRAWLWPAAAAPVFTRVTQLTSGPALDSGPAISPDGKWIAYLSNARGPTDIWVKFLSGGDAINLTAGTGLDVQSRIDLGGLAISPNGSQIAFSAGSATGTPSNLFDGWVIPSPLGGTPRKIVELGHAVRWSPDGSQILFVRAGASAGDALFVAGADGGTPREIVKHRGGMHFHWPAWSPDGRYIYFNYSIQTSNSEPAEIYRVPSTGGEIEPVVATARRAVFPAPTPDGKGLVYSSNPFGVDLGLWWRPIGGKATTPLTTGVGEYAETSIATDGRSMICTLVQQRQALVAFRIAADGTPAAASRAVTDGSTGDFDPTLSRRGDQLVFSSSRSGFRNLWTMRPDGTNALALTSGNVFDERPAFSPDGQRIAFVSDRGGKRGIWIISAGGGIPQPLVDAMVIDRLTWSADGSRIMFATSVGDAPGLESVAVADGRVRPVSTPGPALCPQWLEDGSVAFLEPFRGAPGKPNMNRLALLSQAGERLAPGALGAMSLGNGFFVFTSDRRRVAAIVDRGGSPGSIWVARLDGDGAFRKIADLPADVRPRGAVWTEDAGELIVGIVRRASHLVLFDQVK